MATSKQQNDSNENPLLSDSTETNKQEDKLSKQLLSKKKNRKAKMDFKV